MGGASKGGYMGGASNGGWGWGVGGSGGASFWRTLQKWVVGEATPPSLGRTLFGSVAICMAPGGHGMGGRGRPPMTPPLGGSVGRRPNAGGGH